MKVTDIRRQIEGEKFERLSERTLPPLLNGAVLRRCWFFACHYGQTAKAPGERMTIRNVDLINCKATNNSKIGPVIVDTVDVQNLQTGGLFVSLGAVFRHVTLRGKCGKVMLNFLPSLSYSPHEREAFEDANRRFYEGVDWALDIAEAECQELEIRNVPADLVRRDKDTQVVVRREKVLATQEVWENLDLADTPWAIALRNMIAWGREDTVLIAPKRLPTFAQWRAGLKLLQQAGVAEAD